MTIRLLTILAHPDDETAISGMLARYTRNGSYVVFCSATQGDVGEISDPALATPESLGQVRTAELAAAARAIGIQEIRFLGYRDSGMAGAPQNRDPRAFIQADPHEAVGRIVALIREVRPQVVVTFEPDGWYGHPDHIAASRLTTAAYDLAADSIAYPHAGSPWQPQRLFYAVLHRAGWRKLLAQMQAAGDDTSAFDAFDLNRPYPAEEQTTHVLDILHELRVKRAGMAAHKTQFGPDHPLTQMSDDLFCSVFGQEHFIQARPSFRLEPGAPFIGDLCYGVVED
jgi:LmbE family N-acetylglucosaminyl deacetylase